MADEDRAWGFRTRAVHAGGRPDPTTGARAVPIYQTTSFVFEDAADAADLFALQKFGNIYSRIGNPTVAAFEERMASLEGGIGAVATASGQSAEFLSFAALCAAGRPHRVVGAALRRHPHAARRRRCAASASTTTFVAGRRSRPTTPPLSRPTTQAALHRGRRQPVGRGRRPRGPGRRRPRRRHPAGRRRTMATPYLCRPIEWGADIVVHSATKFLGGHGTSLGGVVVESGRFDWGNGRFPRDDRAGRRPTAGCRWWGNFGEYAFLHPAAGRAAPRRRAGARRRSTPSCSCRASRRCRSGWTPTSPTPAAVAEFLQPAPGGGVGALGRPARPPATTSGPSATCRAGRARCSSFGVRGGRDAGPALHRVGRAVQPPGQHRRRPHARHPPGEHDPPAARRRRARRRRRAGPTSCASRSASRTPTTSCWDLDQALAAATKATDA